MINFTMRIAGRTAAVSAMFESTRDYCAAYLCGGESDFSIAISPEDIAFEREKSVRTDIQEGRQPRKYSDDYLETIAVQRKIAEMLFQYDVLLFHGSVVALDGCAYLFTAKSGTGKSTHTRLWRQAFGSKAVMINDDKPFLHIENGVVTAFGSPWMGKHGLGSNASVPLKAICILERGEENRIQRIDVKSAVPMLLQQSNRPMNKQLLPKYLQLLDELSKHVDFFKMACNMDVQAAVTAYEAMHGKDDAK